MKNGLRYTHTDIFAETSVKAVKEAGCYLLRENYTAVTFYAPTRRHLKAYVLAYNTLNFLAQTIQEGTLRVKPKQDFKGWMFYAEYESKTAKHRDVAHSPQLGLATLQHTNGNVMAVFPEQKSPDGTMASLGTLMTEPQPNTSMLSWGGVSWDYLRDNCKRISFEQAITLHPMLFYGDYFDVEEEN